MGLRRLDGCDIWYSWWDGACCLLADPSSPSRQSSIRPEPLEADLSKCRSQVVTLSSSSLATAVSAGLFHCNAQLLSYRDWQNYTWLIFPWSQGPKTGGVIQKMDQWLEAHRNRCHNTLSVKFQSGYYKHNVEILSIDDATSSLIPSCYSLLIQHLTFEVKWLHTVNCRILPMCLIALMYVFRFLESEGEWRAVGAGKERMGRMFWRAV